MPLKITRPTLQKANTVDELRENVQLVLNEIYRILARLQPARLEDGTPSEQTSTQSKTFQQMGS